jgi:hypothetical protein
MCLFPFSLVFPILVMIKLLSIVGVACLLGATTIEAAYDPTRAMSSLYFCKSAYCDHNTIASWSCGESCNYHNGFVVQGVYTNGSYDAQGFTGYSPADAAIVVAFRGSSNIPNWIADFNFIKMVYPDSDCPGNCEVHEGFFEVYQELAAAVLRDTQTLVRKYPGSRIIVTGHSLGAAVSVHAALDIKRKVSGVTQLEVYNFGEPRVGNPEFAAWVTTVLPDGVQYRVTHASDPVPHLPPMAFGFLHAPHELWYDNNGATSFKNCDDSATSEDSSCSDSTIPIDVSDHLLYLGICTECSCSSFDVDAFKKPFPLKIQDALKQK